MHRFARYATASLVMIAMLGYVVRADVPQVPTGTWAPGGSFGDIPRDVASAVLPDGRLLVTGGSSADGQPVAQIGVYDPNSGTWAPAGQLSEPRAGHTATVLADGRVLIAGGRTTTGLTVSTEIYDPTAGLSTTAGALSVPRVTHAAARLADGRVLIVGGSDGAAVLATAEIFDPATGSISPSPASLVTPRAKHSATTLLDGHVLVAGGNDGTQDLASAEVFDTATGTFALTASLNTPRSGHVAILLPHNNEVLIAGGTSNGNALASVERFSDWNGAFLPDANTMSTPRSGGVSVPTSRDGVVLVAGGGSAEAEFYGFATLKTDKDDYAPGEIVTFTGSGWQPGETVKLTVSEDADTHDDFMFETVADEFGNIVNTEFYPREDDIYHHMGARFYATARGIASEALITFTDAGTLTITFAGDGSGSVAGSGANPAPPGFVGCTSPAGSCSVVYSSNGNVILTATAAPGSTFAGWSSNVQYDPKKDEYSIKMDGNKTITATFTRTSQNQTITFGSLANKTFGDADFNVTATATSGLAVSFTAAGTCSVTGATVHITAVGSCTITANQAGNGQYNPAPAVPQSFTIARATPVVTVTGGDFTYDGAAHAASATAKFNGVDVNGTFAFTYNGTTPAPVNVGSYAIVASFTSTDTNFNNATGNGTISITKANATVVVNGATITYDGQAHGATGTATGVAGEDLASLLDLGATFTNAPGGTVNWSFAGNSNYTAQSGSVAITIDKANATVHVNGVTVTYDGNAHGATGTAAGVTGEDLATLLDLGATFTNAPGGNANWSFAGNGNYNSQSGSVAVTINKAKATVKVTGGEYTYDGAAHGATGSATGVGVPGEDLTSCLSLGDEFTNVPGGTAQWTFTGGTNYEDESGSVEIKINKATPLVSVTGGTFTYDGGSHPASATAAGLSGNNVAGTFSFTYNGSSSEPVNAGTYAVVASFTSADGNYNNARGESTITIDKADPVINVDGGSYTYNGQEWGAHGTATSVTGQDLSALLNLGEKFTNVPGGTANWIFPGDLNHNAKGGSVAIVINPASQLISVTTPPPSSALYNTNFTVAAVGGGSGNPVTYDAAGSCSVVGATFTMTSGYGQCTVTFNQAASNNYSAADAVVRIVNATAWQVGGFYSPVTPSTAANPIWNIVKGGSTVPLKFEIFAGVNGAEQTSLSAIKSIWLQPVNCTGGAALTVDPAQLDNTGGTTLRYDGSQFIQNWKTPATVGCFLVSLQAADNTTISAYFRVK
ncbi:MAG TPA: kelch repeat-containing protein [Vicinamibacterales bacterium]|nr:kelch repeat-containing protein [Vicinamibacterales bacterium]